MKYLLIVLVVLLLPLKGFSQISKVSFPSETLSELMYRVDADVPDVVVSIKSVMGEISISSNESISKVEVISTSGQSMIIGGNNSLLGEDVDIPILKSSNSLLGEDVVIPILKSSRSLFGEDVVIPILKNSNSLLGEDVVIPLAKSTDNVYVVIVTTEYGEVVIQNVVVQ